MENNLLFTLAVGALVGAASGFLGSFMVIKRMSLVGDALSHVALPGLAIALMLGINPMLGAFIALSAAILGVWYLGEKTEIYSEALVGIFFTASLAIGILITPEPELLEALFGNFEKISFLDGVVIIATSLSIYVVIKKISSELLLGVISEELARSKKINVSKINLLYLLAVGLVVAIGVKFVGTLLTGSLVIIPAVAAKNIAKNIKGFQFYAAVIGATSMVIGVTISKIVGIASGPAVVLTSASLFVVSNFIRRKR
ncbi:MAG: ABC-3 protein [Candidatus Woesebacteria bacterium GW2011_GWA1_39_21]|uniref:ABC-3 protein n=1 Tax=Candidatus Woesebacteria bacterium GW2011_GWA1_39_21 TaxID=1618550 RepID=A0A0G0QN74_9BACT|nr:MAG: ABC-3 protein [Candidatus Woesebacteria bacterium GW2011_GWA1_39_21]